MQLNTLGTLRLTEGTLTRPKPLLLLSYLALEGPKPRRHLADLFFHGAKDPADALSTTVRRLRRLGDVIEETHDGRLSCPLACDARRLLELLDGGLPDEAIDLHRAPFVHGLTLRMSTELEEWVFATREYIAGRLRGAAIRAAEGALAGHDRRGAARYAGAAIALQGAPELEPDELVRLHAVLRTTHRHRADELRREAAHVGVQLGPVDDAAGAGRGRPALPVLPTSLVGRDLELVEVAEALADPDCRLLCIRGPGGVGKTRLALQAAYEQRRQNAFRDGVAFVSLEALTHARQVPHAIASALGLAAPSGDDPWTGLAEALAQKHLLLVLDNLEHLKEAATRLNELLVAGPDLMLLVTSRERLNLTTEWVLTLAGLPVPTDGMDLDRALMVDGLRLFVARAKRTELSFALSDADLVHAVAICRLVGGLPLGLELAASWTKVVPLADIAASLTENLAALDVPLRDVPLRHRSLRAVLEGSWSLLDEEERRVLRRLAVFHGGFRREAAARVAGASIAHLTSLADKSLLRMLPNGRFERHVLLHQFTREKLAERPAEEATARERHGEYVVRLLNDASARAGAAEFGALFELLEAEEGNVLACLDWAVDTRRAESLLALSDPLLWYFPMRGRFHEGAAVFAGAIAKLDPDDAATREAYASLALGQSFLARFAGDLEEAMALATTAERLARASGSGRQTCRALNVLGQAIMFAGRYEASTAMLEEAVQLARDAGDTTLLFRGLGNLVLAHAVFGDYARARVLAREAREIFDSGAMPAGFESLGVFLAIGVLHGCEGDWRAARDVLERADVTADHVRYYGMASVIRALLANAHVELGRSGHDPTATRAAARHVARGLDSAASTNEAMGRSLLHGVQSRLALQDGNASAAERWATEAVSVAWRHHNLTIVFWALPRLADAYAALGKLRDTYVLIRLMTLSDAAPAWVRAAARRLREDLAESLPRDEVAAHVAAAADVSLEQAISDVTGPRSHAVDHEG